MTLPFFHTPDLSAPTLTLDEPTSKHIVSVLRMTVGEALLLTDGQGQKATAQIVDDNRKRCTVQIQRVEKEEPVSPHVTIAISPTKNNSRFEWFLEKATEIGVAEIIPLLCDRTEKDRFRPERLQGILVSAMLQSQQCRLPRLHEPTAFATLVKNAAPQPANFIAHCLPNEKINLDDALRSSSSFQINPSSNRLILIGPEGDFTPKEIELALQQGFIPVALGHTRLRTETAGMVAAALLRNASV